VKLRRFDAKNAINPKNFKFSLTLALTFVFSLREVRLKIGEYYFNRGNFDQAVNWYQKQQR
jgi:hypothetical protein